MVMVVVEMVIPRPPVTAARIRRAADVASKRVRRWVTKRSRR
jgi:hypothetical protein